MEYKAFDDEQDEFGIYDGIYNVGLAYNEEYAALFAAAKDMRAALEALVSDKPKTRSQLDTARAQALAALDKAKTEEA